MDKSLRSLNELRHQVTVNQVEAARLLKCSERTIRNYIKDKKLKPTKLKRIPTKQIRALEEAED